MHQVEPVSGHTTAQFAKQPPIGQYTSAHTREYIHSASDMYRSPRKNHILRPDLSMPTPTLTLFVSEIGAPTICVSIPRPFFLSIRIDLEYHKPWANIIDRL